MKIKQNKNLFGLFVALSFCMSITYAEHVYCDFSLAQKDLVIGELPPADGVEANLISIYKRLNQIQWDLIGEIYA